MKEPILKTKVIPPRIPEQTIYRNQLIELLETNLNKRAILICAGAGYGKTTLLVQFIRKFKIPHIWYQLDKSDRDFNLFMQYLIEGVKRYHTDFGKRTLNVISNIGELSANIEVAMGTFINELVEISDERILFLFDDFHHVSVSKNVISGFEHLLRHIPPNISIMVSTRTYPPFSLERFYFKKEILEIDQNDLKFNDDEIKMLCERVSGYIPKVAELKRLKNDSEGWITYLQFLIKPSKQQKLLSFKSKKSLIKRLYDYFDREVFYTLEEDIKFFLITTSVFDYISPEACNFLLSRDDSEQILQKLKQRYLFIYNYDEPRPMYRYHHLFLEFLVNKLMESGYYQKFQKRAGMYWEKEGFYSKAIEHFLEADNFRSAARLTKLIGDDYISVGKFEFINNCLKRLPKAFTNNDPTLNRLQGIIYVFNNDWVKAKNLFQKAKRLASSQKNYREVFHVLCNHLQMNGLLGKSRQVIREARKALSSKRLKGSRLRIRFLRILGSGLFYEGRLNNAAEIHKETLRLSKRTGRDVLINSSLHNLALTNLARGDFTNAQNCFKTLIEKLSPNPIPMLMLALNNLGTALMFQGNLDESKEVIEEVQKYAKIFNSRRGFCESYTNLGCVKLFSNNLYEAEQELKKAEKECLEIGYYFMLSDIWERMADLLLNRGNFLEARRYIDKSLEIHVPSLIKASHQIIKAKVELSLKNLDAAEQALKEAKPRLKESKYQLMRLHLQFGRLYLLRKDRLKAYKFLSKAFKSAEKHFYDFLLIYDLKTSPEIIRFVLDENIELQYLQRILSKIPHLEIVKSLVEPKISDFDLTIRLFGKVEIFVAGELLKKPWRSKRFKELFCYLIAHRPTIVTREKIASIFWPEHSPSAARQLFHNALYKIRSIVDQNIIVFNKGGYTLSSKYTYWIDAEEFDTLIKEGDKLRGEGDRVACLIKYEQAVSLYRGLFMEDFYSDWCQQKQRYFEGVYIDVLGRLSNGYYKIGNYEKALKFCNLLIDKDPYNEDICCLAMRCYAKLKNIKGLQNCFTNLKKNLVKGLKTVPRPEIVQLFEELIRKEKLR